MSLWSTTSISDPPIFSPLYLNNLNKLINKTNFHSQQLFDAELKKRFKAIEMNFVRPQGMDLPSGERVAQYWNLMA